MKPLNFREADIDFRDLQGIKSRCMICAFHKEGICRKYQYKVCECNICDSYSQADQTYCMSCGQNYDEKETVCPFCGIKNPIRLNQVLDKKEEDKRWMLLLAIPFIVITTFFVPYLIFGWFALFMAYSNKDRLQSHDW
jgi:hypothetical protein